MIPQTDATRALLADIDARNRTLHADAVLRERIRGLIHDYLAPTPSDGAGVVGIPVPAAVPPPHRWRPDSGPAATPSPAVAVQVGDAGMAEPAGEDGRRLGTTSGRPTRPQPGGQPRLLAGRTTQPMVAVPPSARPGAWPSQRVPGRSHLRRRPGSRGQRGGSDWAVAAPHLP